MGVLALQGAFQLHQAHVEAAGAEYVEVVTATELEKIHGLILPGGESGVMLKLIASVGLSRDLLEFVKTKPTWGICAGAILLAKKVLNPNQDSLGVLDIEIERNAYGRQLESIHEMAAEYEVSYIRAPRIKSAGDKVQVYWKREGHPAWVESGTLMATTFHPETNAALPSPWHLRLLKKIQS